MKQCKKLKILLKKKKIDINITCISKNSLTLQKAEKSKKFDFFKFKFLTKINIKKIKKADQILKILSKEFNTAKKNGFNKYDVWTKILHNSTLSYFYNSLPLYEKKNYNLNVFSKIRNLTRYTYPATVEAKEKLEELGKIKFINDRIIKIIKTEKYIKLITKKNLSLNGDIVVNVSGPVNILKNTNEIKYLNSLKKISKKYNDRGFYVGKNSNLSNNIFIPGTLSYNFNPLRETIIKAITNNTFRAVKKILRVY